MTREAHRGASGDAEHPLARLAQVPLLGRDPLLAGLRASLAKASASSRGRCLLLCGDPGIGKTRIAEELVRAAPDLGFAVFASRCHETEGAPALWPWVQLTRALLAERARSEAEALVAAGGSALGRWLPELAGRSIGESEAVPSGDSGARFELFAALAATFQHAARQGPLLLVVDDLHWADTASLLFARFLVREAHGSPIALLCTYRDSEVAAGYPLADALQGLAGEAESFRLEGIEEDDVARFMEHVAGFEVASVLAAAVHAQTGGNPLFVCEVVRLLASEDRLGAPDSSTPAALALPETVRHTLRRRLRAAPSGVRDLLARASVIGSSFAVEVLARSAGLEQGDVLRRLDEAREVRLVVASGHDPGRFRFAHDLIRDTLYDDLPSAERVEQHLAIARTIEVLAKARPEAHYAELAHHFFQGVPAGGARPAAFYALRAAQEADLHFSYEEAARQFELSLRALDLADIERDAGSASDEERFDALLGLGNVLWRAGDRETSRVRHRAAVELARRLSDPERLARAAVSLTGLTDLPMSFPAEASETLEEALRALPEADDRMRAQVLTSLVRASYFGGRRERVEAWAREAVASAERLGDPATLFAAHDALHYALLHPASFDARLRIGEQLLELARATGSRRYEVVAHLWRVVDLLEVPDVRAADGELARFDSLARELNQPFFRWLATAFRATRALMEGRLDDMERLMHAAMEEGQRAESPNAVIFFGTQLFHLREEQGRAAELEPLMRRIADENPALPVFRIGVPLIYALCDRREEARAEFEQVAARDFEDVPHDLHRIPMLTSAGIVAAYLGDARRARLLHRELIQHEGRVLVAGVATWWGGSMDHYLGVLEVAMGELDRAVQHFESALAVAKGAGARLQAAHAARELGAALRLRGGDGDEARGRALRAEARAAYRELGCEWRLAQMDQVDELDAPAADGGAPSRDEPLEDARVSRQDGGWEIAWGGARFELPDSKGLQYLARLLEEPDRELHVVELVASHAKPPPASAPSTSSAAASEPGLRVTRGGTGDAVLDARARAEYGARLTALESELEEAESLHDLERARRLREEIDFLEQELRAALGLGGRARTSQDPVERARKSVYNRIRAAVERIGAKHPPLGVHLQRSIRTGTFCVYRPERPTRWLVRS
ncbi:MAG: AAA family ATPase [Myxococcota bacterium]|nr:AAA family ATPase [Myxococcota bacterium]